MKKTIVASIIFLSFGVASFAQEYDAKPVSKEEHMEMRKKMKEKMAKKLELTPEQMTKINAIDAKYEKQEDELHEKAEALRKERRALMDAKRAEVKKVLTQEQAQKVEEMESRRLERGPRKMRPNRGSKPMRPE